MILFRIGILLKRSDKKPSACFFDINFDFLDLQIAHVDLTIYFLFIVTNPLNLNL